MSIFSLLNFFLNFVKLAFILCLLRANFSWFKYRTCSLTSPPMNMHSYAKLGIVLSRNPEKSWDCMRATLAFVLMLRDILCLSTFLFGFYKFSISTKFYLSSVNKSSLWCSFFSFFIFFVPYHIFVEDYIDPTSVILILCNFCITLDETEPWKWWKVILILSLAWFSVSSIWWIFET